MGKLFIIIVGENLMAVDLLKLDTTTIYQEPSKGENNGAGVLSQSSRTQNDLSFKIQTDNLEC